VPTGEILPNSLLNSLLTGMYDGERFGEDYVHRHLYVTDYKALISH